MLKKGAFSGNQFLSCGLARSFAKKKVRVLMIRDYPELGFQGEIRRVRPGIAENKLYPNLIAIPAFPGVYKRMFPERLVYLIRTNF